MKACFDPGTLNHYVNLEMPLETTDGFGGMVVSWMPVATIWAALQPLATAIRQIAQQASETQTHSIAIRYRDDISSGWRLTLNQRVFEIETLFDPDERGRYLILMTREVGR